MKSKLAIELGTFAIPLLGLLFKIVCGWHMVDESSSSITLPRCIAKSGVQAALRIDGWKITLRRQRVQRVEIYWNRWRNAARNHELSFMPYSLILDCDCPFVS